MIFKLQTELDGTAGVLGFVDQLRAKGVVQFSGGGISLALGPLPMTDAPTTKQREQPGDALDVALRLRGTRPDDKPGDEKSGG